MMFFKALQVILYLFHIIRTHLKDKPIKSIRVKDTRVVALFKECVFGNKIKKFYILFIYFIKYIQNQLGHASPVVTLEVYAHLMKPVNQEAACRLENTIFQTNGSKTVAETKKGSAK